MKKIAFLLTVAVVLNGISVSRLFAQTPKLNDAEIASVAVTANQVDIDYAKVATAKSKNEEVLNFAKTMMNDHQAVIDQAVALVTKLKVTPQDNDVSKKLNSDAAAMRKKLEGKSDKDFDKAYIDNEVSYHKAVISTVKDVLIPQAQNAELKALLEKVMPALKTHLEHAEMVQKSLSKK